MRAGDLDRVIEIQRRTTGLDLYGTVIDTWATFATMRAKLMQFVIDDREAQRGQTTDAVITFRTRWLDGLTLEHRVVYQGNTYTIRNLKELGRRIGFDIICERSGP
ncbi:head-tail adaptor protein [Bradyrhizobium sp. CCBAU 51753]|uniref:head-tail adaptor protein n=1 Tax=Bradyrhizobium sp. CCBAU 51753 TaxID=1325100 RepID=UPI00188D79D1|nr:head-tail adaptor protein [Bradyrhizobium sp. CCBAU 51753]QOZ26165.1 head-tail adaptor protein [Bradyrhizobium sp. CCBAU 51753]